MPDIPTPDSTSVPAPIGGADMPPGGSAPNPKVADAGKGEGRSMAVRAGMANVIQILHQALTAFPPESKDFAAISGALKTLIGAFGASEDSGGLRAMAAINLARQGSPRQPSGDMPGGGGLAPGMVV